MWFSARVNHYTCPQAFVVKKISSASFMVFLQCERVDVWWAGTYGSLDPLKHHHSNHMTNCGAVVWLLTSVNTKVIYKTVFAWEWLVTATTTVWLLSSMNSEMFCQTAFLWEWLVTAFTLVWLLCMNPEIRSIRWPLSENDLSQHSHWYGFSPVCILRCFVRLLFCENDWWQHSHQWGFSLAWILTCVVRLPLYENDLSQYWHW